MKKLSIVIPAYNEAKTIRRLVERIFTVAFPIDIEVIVVDDHSKDRTLRIMKILEKHDLSDRIKLFHNDRNRGKGFSIRRGFEHVTGDLVVVQDADFEYDPHEIPRLMEPVLRGEVDVVYGSRFLNRRRPEGMALPNWVANVFLTGLTNLLYGGTLTDMETCYKLFRAELVRDLPLEAERFDFEPEITTELLKRGVKIKELPIKYRGRTAEEGKKIKARDFFIAVWVLVRLRFRSPRGMKVSRTHVR